MVLETSRFGAIRYEDGDLLQFPDGIPGFSKLTKFLLVERVDDDLFLWLQSVQKPAVAFPLLEPQIVEPTYELILHPEDKESLKGPKLRDVRAYAIITIPSDPSKMTANLRAPIVINVNNRIGIQAIHPDDDYPIRKAIFERLQSYCAASQRTVFPTTEVCTYQPHRLEAPAETSPSA